MKLRGGWQRWMLGPGFLLAAAGLAVGQAVPAATGPGVLGDDAVVTPVNGFNFSLNNTGQHDSATGWADIVNPTLIYRFNRHFFATATTPYYPFVYAFVPVKAGSSATVLQEGHNLLGDTVVSGSFEQDHGSLSYQGVALVGFSTGNVRFGLSANQTTYNITQHLDYSVGIFDPEVEIGIGDSSNLVNRAVQKAYVAVGTLANFQVGTGIELPWNVNLDLDAYEDLPVGNQNVYGTVTRKNKQGKQVTKQVLEGTGAAEDNGFATELTIPLRARFQLVGTYERSLIQGLDTVSMGVTFTLRPVAVLRHAGGS